MNNLRQELSDLDTEYKALKPVLDEMIKEAEVNEDNMELLDEAEELGKKLLEINRKQTAIINALLEINKIGIQALRYKHQQN